MNDPVAPACETLTSLARQQACFQRLARGTDLAAQNALYTLGIIARDVQREPERALESFRAYGRRFPSGLHAPEAALGVLDLLQRKGLAEESIEAALEFERRFATDGRVPEVMLVRADLLCRDPARRDEALALIDRVSLRRESGVTAAAARARARCLAAEAPPGAMPPAAQDP